LVLNLLESSFAILLENVLEFRDNVVHLIYIICHHENIATERCSVDVTSKSVESVTPPSVVETVLSPEAHRILEDGDDQFVLLGKVRVLHGDFLDLGLVPAFTDERNENGWDLSTRNILSQKIK
jgi:hypothetical protein